MTLGLGSLFFFLSDRIDPELEIVPSSSEARSLTSSSSTVIGTHSSAVLSLATASGASAEASSNNFLLASGGADNTVKVWRGQWNQESITRQLPEFGHANAIAFSPEGTRLFAGSGAGYLQVWDAATGDRTGTISGEAGRITSLSVAPSGEQLAFGSSQGALKIWNFETDPVGREIESLVSTGSPVNAIAYSPVNPDLLISGEQSGTLSVWNLSQSRSAPALILNDSAGRITSLAISPDGQLVASGSDDPIIRLWNIETGELTQKLSGHQLAVADVAFSADGQYLASGSHDGSLKVWDLSEGVERCTLKGHTGFVYAVDFEGNTRLVSSGYDGTVRAWDLSDSANQHCTAFNGSITQ